MAMSFLRLVIAGCFLSALASASAFAQMYKWTDEKGKVHYSERRMSNKASGVANRVNSGGYCEGECRARLEQDKFNSRLEKEMENVPANACRFPYKVMSSKSKARALAAKEECKRNYAMKRIDPSYSPQQTAGEESRRVNENFDRRLEAVQRQAQLQETNRQRQVQLQETNRRLARIEAAQQQRELNERFRSPRSNAPDEIRLRSGYGTGETRCKRSAGMGSNTYTCD